MEIAENVNALAQGIHGIISCILLLGQIVLSIMAIVIGGGMDSETCVGDYGDMNMNYAHYLIVYGWTTIGIIIFVFMIMCSIAMCHKNETDVLIGMAVMVGVVILYSFFNIAWFIIGAVLYFNTVEQSCLPGNLIYDFGLALFIIQIVLMAYNCAVQSQTKQAVEATEA